MNKTTVLYASRVMTGKRVKEVSRQVRGLLTSGKEIEANILMLRNAGRRSDQLLRKEVDEWQPLRKLG